MIALRVCAAAAVAGVLAPGAAADVWRVPGQVANIKLAVSAAEPGDVILVAPGDYTEVVILDGKGLTLVAETSASVATLEVRNVPVGQTAVVDGFQFDLPDVFAGPDVPFALVDNAGAVRIQDCTFLGDPGFAGFAGGQSPYPGTPGATVLRSRDVIFDGCHFEGGSGANLVDGSVQFFGTSGGAGLEVDEASLVVAQSTCRGGSGGDQNVGVSFPGGSGGAGVRAFADTFVFVTASELIGGAGGSARCSGAVCGQGGAGGDGVLLTSGLSEVWVRGNTFDPGAGGQDGDGQGVGLDSEAVRGGIAT